MLSSKVAVALLLAASAAASSLRASGAQQGDASLAVDVSDAAGEKPRPASSRLLEPHPTHTIALSSFIVVLPRCYDPSVAPQSPWCHCRLTAWRALRGSSTTSAPRSARLASGRVVAAGSSGTPSTTSTGRARPPSPSRRGRCSTATSRRPRHSTGRRCWSPSPTAGHPTRTSKLRVVLWQRRWTARIALATHWPSRSWSSDGLTPSMLAHPRQSTLPW